MNAPFRAAAVAIALSACSGRSAHAPAAGAPARKDANGDAAWGSLSWEDRHDTMTFLVLPTMARLFQRYRSSPDPDLTCRSCHGADGERVQYAMPHGLAPLDPEHLPDARDPDPNRARIAKFMADEVTPTMADLLGVEPYDPRTKRGFFCFNCHPSTAGPERGR